jgi:hypothetical protein
MNIYHRLDDVQMSAIDREHAKAHMRRAELTIDFVAAVVAKVRSISAALGRLIVNLARRIQLSNRRAAQQ